MAFVQTINELRADTLSLPYADRDGVYQSPLHSALEKIIMKNPDQKEFREFKKKCEKNKSYVAQLTADEIIREICHDTFGIDTSSKQWQGLKDVVYALKEFNDIISQMVSAYPFPTALIWGGLKIFIDAAYRHYQSYETIQTELQNLATYLFCARNYEQFYGYCTDMQEILCDVYASVIQFLFQAHQHVNRSGFRAKVKSFSPNFLNKIQGTVEELHRNFEKLAIFAEVYNKGNTLETLKRQRAETLCRRLGCEEVYRSQLELKSRNDRNRVDGTCKWLHEIPEFSSWVGAESKKPFLWVHAPPGAGKSTLCSYAIVHVQKLVLHGTVAFHFCRFDEELKIHHILSSLALQVITPGVAAQFSSQWFKPPGVEELQQIIKVSIRQLPAVCLFLDGLDESLADKSRWEAIVRVLKFLAELSKEFPTVRIWCTSQHLPQITTAMDSFKEQLLELNAEDMLKVDVAFFLSTRENDKEIQENLDKVPDGRTLFKSLCDRASCNFLWAKLMTDSLVHAGTPLDMKELLESAMPPASWSNTGKDEDSLDSYYKRIISHFKGSDLKDARDVFSIVTFARRPLRVRELIEAFAMLRSRPTSQLNVLAKPFSSSKMLQKFAPLIEVQEQKGQCYEDSVCQLFHSTVKKFFERNHDALLNCNEKSLYQKSRSKTPDPGQASTLETPDRESVFESLPLITKYRIADACLLYLSQSVFETPLQKGKDGWQVGRTGSAAGLNSFLIYCAKYWDRHLDNLDTDPDPDFAKYKDHFLPRILEFTQSPNFLMCIQVQSLWVEGQFSILARQVLIPHHRRIFPNWFANEGKGQVLRQNYISFVREWMYFLKCGICECPGDLSCAVKPYAGEVGRMWCGALRQENFLSRFPGRYKSFAFESDSLARQPKIGTGSYSNKNLTFDSVDPSGKYVKLIRQVSQDSDGTMSDELRFNYEHWTLEDGMSPTLLYSKTIRVNAVEVNWHLYAVPEGADSMEPPSPVKAVPVSFSKDLRLIRIGSLVLVECPDYSLQRQRGIMDLITTNVCSKGPLPQPLPYIEECASRGCFLVLASRRKTRVRSQSLDRNSRDSDVESECRSDDSESDTSFSEGCAYESLSECSSQMQDEEYEDDKITPWTDAQEADYHSDTSFDSDSEPQLGSESDLEYNADEDEDNDENNDEDEDSDEDKDEYEDNKDEDEDKDEDEGDDDNLNDKSPSHGEDYSWPMPVDAISSDDSDSNVGLGQRCTRIPRRCTGSGDGKRRRIETTPYAEISVYSTNSSIPTRLFHFRQSLALNPFLLRSSPPVIHPTASLVVWPLDHGNILFGNFEDNTYFIRRLRPSTSRTIQIFIQCHFSACGGFLHVAVLEAQVPQPPKSRPSKAKEPTEDDDGPKVKLALFVTTHSLCHKRPSKSPPNLVHRVRVDLRSESGISISNLPYTLTWGDRKLYFTISHLKLLVYQIQLFSSEVVVGASSPVLCPRDPLFLPASAENRAVHFFPPVVPVGGDYSKRARHDGLARVIIGAWGLFTSGLSMRHANKMGFERIVDDALRLEPSPPIGCFVREQEDLGGWVDWSGHTTVRENRGVGQLNNLMEKFNPDDDCDLEPYIY